MEKKLQLAALQVLFSNAKALMTIKDAEGRYLMVSNGFLAHTDLPEGETVLGKRDADIFRDKKLAEKYQADDKRIIASGEHLLSFPEFMPTPDGKGCIFLAFKYALRDGDRVIGILSIYKGRYGGQPTLSHEIDLDLHMALRNMSVSVWEYDIKSNRIFRTNLRDDEADFQQEFGAADPMSLVQSGFVHPDSADAFEEFIGSINRGVRDGDGFMQIKKPNGDEYGYEHAHFTTLLDNEGKPYKAIIISEDITEQQQSVNRLARAAERDSMTGLLNHGACLKKIASFIDNDPNGTHALMWIDMDKFKDINDTFGHLYGDSVIKKSAGIIEASFRGSDIVGRVGGDEFVVLMKDAPDLDFIERKAGELVENLTFDCQSNGVTITVSASIGVSVHSGGQFSLTKLLADADAALYKAKAAGRNCYYMSDQADR